MYCTVYSSDVVDDIDSNNITEASGDVSNSSSIGCS